jgi:integrase
MFQNHWSYGITGLTLAPKKVSGNMPVEWKSSRYPGIRFYEHKNRKHGVRFDRYYAIRFQSQGKRREEGLGWSSDGWTEKKAVLELAKLKEAARKGEGPVSLAEKRAQATVKRKAEQEAAAKAKRDSLTFGVAFHKHYLPHTSQTKSKVSVRGEKGVFHNYMAPLIGNLPLIKIAPIHIERIRKDMRDQGLAHRTIHRVIQVVRQVYNHCRRMGLYYGEIPTDKISRTPKTDDRRQRFLNQQEAHDLLAELASRSKDLHDQALLSLYTGMRAGEVFALIWADVDIGHGFLMLRNTKNGTTRHVPMTKRIKAMFAEKKRLEPHDFVFPSRTGKRRTQVSKSFSLAVEKLGFNKSVTDPKLKVVFHTLRHTFASWLVMAGTPLYTVGKLLGHSSSAMTERYSHLAPDHLREAVNSLNDMITHVEPKTDADQEAVKSIR